MGIGPHEAPEAEHGMKGGRGCGHPSLGNGSFAQEKAGVTLQVALESREMGRAEEAQQLLGRGLVGVAAGRRALDGLPPLHTVESNSGPPLAQVPFEVRGTQTVTLPWQVAPWASVAVKERV